VKYENAREESVSIKVKFLENLEVLGSKDKEFQGFVKWVVVQVLWKIKT